MTDLEALEEAFKGLKRETIHNWRRQFRIYNYCTRCSQGQGFNGGLHDAKRCQCCCHVKGMMMWIHKYAKDLSLELVEKMIDAMEDDMMQSIMPIHLVDEIRKMRDEAIEAAAVKLL